MYVDLIWVLNFYIDFWLLYITSLILKRNIKIFNIIIASLVGSLSTLLVFFKINNFILIIIKIFLAIIMLLISFGHKNIKYSLTNFIYFYMLGVILGGFIYYLNIEFKYTTVGLILSNHHININYILLFISPFILIIYQKYLNKIKVKNSLIYDIKIVINKNIYKLKGYLDTGNKLIDPITNKPVILIEKDIISESLKYYYIPFNSIGNHNLLKCFKPLYVEINEKKYKNYLIAISDKKFNIDGVECILNNKLMEEI